MRQTLNEYILELVLALAIAGIVGGIAMHGDVAKSQEKITEIDKRSEELTTAIQNIPEIQGDVSVIQNDVNSIKETLRRIEASLNEIAKEEAKTRVEAAKYHHVHKGSGTIMKSPTHPPEETD